MKKLKIFSISMMALTLLTLASCGKVNLQNWARPSGTYRPATNTSTDITPTTNSVPQQTVTYTETVVQSDFEYTLLNNGTYSVKKYNQLDKNTKYLEIPRKAKDGKEVTQISANAFKDCTNLESIYVGDNIVKIEKTAFSGCGNLKDITLPFIGESKTDNYPFGYVFGETSYTNSVKVREDLYDNNKYKEGNYYLPKALETITITNESKVPYSGFRNIETLKTLNLNEDIIEIDNFAFSNTKLTDINISDNVKVNDYTFEGANIQFTKYLKVKNENGCTYVGTSDNPYRSLIKISDSATTVNINPNCLYAPKNILESKNKIKKLYIPISLSNKIDVPSTLDLEEAQLSSKQFQNLSNKKINVLTLNDVDEIYSNDNSYYYSEGFNNVGKLILADNIGYFDYSFYYSDMSFNTYGSGYYIGTKTNPYYMLVKTNGNNNITIHSDTVQISNRALENCYATSITIPASVKYIGSNVFNYSLSNIYIEGNIEYLATDAFANANNISNYSSYNGCRYIGDAYSSYKWAYKYDSYNYYSSVSLHSNTVGVLYRAFDGYNSLNSITLNSNLKGIGDYAFRNTNITYLSIPNSVTKVGSEIVEGCNINYNISGNGYYLGNNSNSYLFFARPKNDNITTLTINSNCKFVDYNSLSNLSNKLTELIIPSTAKAASPVSYLYFDKLEKVEAPANIVNNSNLSNVKEVVINKSDRTINNYNGDYFYFGSSNLTKLTINEEIKKIDYYGDYTKITNLSSYNGGKYIGTKDNPYYMLYKLNNNSTSKINQNTEVIGRNALYNESYSSYISTLTIPASVKYIGEYAFSNCKAKKIEFEGIPEYVDSTAFSYSYNIESSYENGKYIGDSFNPYYLLVDGNNTTKIHKDTKVIGTYAFANNNTISTITIPNGVRIISSYAFNVNNSLTSITIPSSVEEIGGCAFYGNSKLKTVYINEGVKRIEWNAFSECDSLTSIVIPDSVTFINSTTFDRCANLEYIVMSKNITNYYIYTVPSKLKYIYYNGTLEEFESETRYFNENVSKLLYFYSSSRPSDTTHKYYYKEAGNYKIWS